MTCLSEMLGSYGTHWLQWTYRKGPGQLKLVVAWFSGMRAMQTVESVAASFGTSRMLMVITRIIGRVKEGPD